MEFKLLDDLIGAEYAIDGRGPTYDCYGLVIEVARRYGIVLPSFTGNTTIRENHNKIAEGLAVATRLDAKSNYCVVLLAPVSKFSSHLGFVLKYPYFMHIQNGSNATISKLNSLFWKTRVRGFYK